MKDDMKLELSEVDKMILSAMKKSDEPLTTYQIGKNADISWSTANSHCYKLMSMGLIKCQASKSRAGSGKKMMWWI